MTLSVPATALSLLILPLSSPSQDHSQGPDAASAGQGEVLELVVEIAAPIDAVWHALTTAEGYLAWAGVAHAEIDLSVGGSIRTSYVPESTLGDEHTIEQRILSFDPPRMLSAQLARVPAGSSFEELRETWSIMYLEPLGPGRTRYTSRWLGWGEGEEWDRIRAFFEDANPQVIAILKRHLEGAGADADTPGDTENPEGVRLAPPAPEADSYRAHVAAAAAALRGDDVAAARRWLDAAPHGLRGWEWRQLDHDLDDSAGAWDSAGGTVHALAWSPDSSRLASGAADGTIEIRDRNAARGAATDAPAARSEALVRLTGHTGAPRSLAWTADGARLASAAEDGTLRIWDAATGVQLALAEIAGTNADRRTARGLWWSPDGTRLALALPGVVELRDGASGAPIAALAGAKRWPLAVCARFEGEHVLTAYWDHRVKVWTATDGALVEEREAPAGVEAFHAYHDLNFDDAGTRLVGATFDGLVRVVDLRSGAVATGRCSTPRQAFAATCSPDGTRVAAVYVDGAVRTWDATTGDLVAVLHGHAAPAHAIAYSPDGRHLVSGGEDARIRLWAPDARGGPARLVSTGSAVWAAPFSRDGGLLATAASDRLVTVWDVASGALERRLEGFGSEATSLAFTADGGQLYAASNDHVVRLFDLASGALVREFGGHTSGVPNIALAPDGGHLATACYDGKVRVFDTSTGSLAFELALPAYDVEYEPNGARLAIAAKDGSIVIVAAATGATIRNLDSAPHPDGTLGIAWSPDASRLLSGGQSGTVRLWDVASGAALMAQRPHLGSVYKVAFHPDGDRFATASYDLSVKLWDAATGGVVRTWELPDKAYYVEFDPAGERLAVSTLDGAVTLYEVR